MILAAPCSMQVTFSKLERRKMVIGRDNQGRICKAPVYLDGEDVNGKVKIDLVKGMSKVDHKGIRVELIGFIENQ